MPRPNKRRGVFAEDHLAQRIAAERDARGWTNDGLAKRMTDAGCPMTGSAIFKIEKMEPRRRIVVDELVTFAKVFGIPLEELLLAPEVAASKEATRLVLRWSEAAKAADPLIEAQNVAADAIYDYITAHPDARGAMDKALKTVTQGNHNLWAGDEDPPARELNGAN
jgi:transcriptional regulator with XRE-family HTH domain